MALSAVGQSFIMSGNKALTKAQFYIRRNGNPSESGTVLTLDGDHIGSTNLVTTQCRLRTRAEFVTDFDASQIGLKDVQGAGAVEHSIFWVRSADNYVSTRDSSTTNVVAAITIGSYSVFEILYQPSTSSDFYQNNTLLSHNTLNVPDDQQYVQALSSLTAPDVYIDWLFLMRWVAEPSWGATGTEETPPAGAISSTSIIPIMATMGMLK
jgi:hypothetical protein